MFQYVQRDRQSDRNLKRLSEDFTPVFLTFEHRYYSVSYYPTYPSHTGLSPFANIIYSLAMHVCFHPIHPHLSKILICDSEPYVILGCFIYNESNMLRLKMLTTGRSFRAFNSYQF